MKAKQISINDTMPINQALREAVCYIHFIRLVFGGWSYYSIYKYLGNTILKPFRIIWDNRNNNENNRVFRLVNI